MKIEEHFPDEDKKDERVVMAAVDVVIDCLLRIIEKGVAEGRYIVEDGVVRLRENTTGMEEEDGKENSGG